MPNIQLPSPAECSAQLCPGTPEPRKIQSPKSPGSLGPGNSCQHIPVSWCTPAQESSRGRTGCLSCPWVAVGKVTLQRSPCPLLPVLAWWQCPCHRRHCQALPEGRSFMAAAQFFFFIIAVDLMSTANADLCIRRRGGGCSALLRSPSGGHGHSPQVLPRGRDRTGLPQLPQAGWAG